MKNLSEPWLSENLILEVNINTGSLYITNLNNFKQKPMVCKAKKTCGSCRAGITVGGDDYYHEDAQDICAFGHIKLYDKSIHKYLNKEYEFIKNGYLNNTLNEYWKR